MEKGIEVRFLGIISTHTHSARETFGDVNRNTPLRACFKLRIRIDGSLSKVPASRVNPAMVGGTESMTLVSEWMSLYIGRFIENIRFTFPLT